jgi:hypothetical protein
MGIIHPSPKLEPRFACKFRGIFPTPDAIETNVWLES